MPKPATLWRTPSGYDSVTSTNAGFSLLLENGGNLLLESGGELLLEGGVVTPKSPISWTLESKTRTSWVMPDGSSSFTQITDTRLTEQGNVRITEQGNTRALESSLFTPKSPTEWTDA